VSSAEINVDEIHGYERVPHARLAGARLADFNGFEPKNLWATSLMKADCSRHVASIPGLEGLD
jgi:hypothetical protein